jgi:hypothetical protein
MLVNTTRTLKAITVALLLAGPECTVLLDHSPAQCETDADCQHFGGHPYCRASTCVRSYLQPTDCLLATPARPPGTRAEFLNQCSLNYLPDPTGTTCLSFDNCSRVPGICGSANDAGIMGPPAPPPLPDAGATTPPINVPTGSPPPSCEAAAGAPVVYLTGSSNFPPLLKKVAPVIRKLTGRTPVFKTTDSCTGASSMYLDGTGAFRSAHYIGDPAPGSGAAYAQYFDAQGGHACTLGGRVEVDIGESEIYAETCGLSRDLSHVRELPGPILPILFVVPNVANGESAISAEAARQVFGNGGHVAPWLNSALFFVRGTGTATTRLIGLAVDVPVPSQKFWGIDQGTAEKLAANLSAVQDPSEAHGAIGILGSDFYDQNKLSLKALAFQAKGQSCAYLPDSSSNTRDKINVRDGHYPIWGLLHFFAALGPDGLPSDTSLAFLRQFAEPLSPEMLDAFIEASWVPNCAMMVQRSAELGDLTAETPPHPCGCHFDAKVSPSGRAPEGCKVCTSNNDCIDPQKPSCNFGYCEVEGK